MYILINSIIAQSLPQYSSPKNILFVFGGGGRGYSVFLHLANRNERLIFECVEVNYQAVSNYYHTG